MTLKELLPQITERLKSAGVDAPVLDGELICAQAMGLSRSFLLAHDTDLLSPEICSIIESMVVRREERIPLAYILGHKEFFGLQFQVTPSVLIPRPETELMIEAALSEAPPNARVLDLCTGSGAIAVTLKHERPDLDVTATDISHEALEVAKLNCRSLLTKESVQFLQGDLFEPVEGAFDLILTNPPYIDFAEQDELQKELTYEPELALYTEESGERVPRIILEEFRTYLVSDGFFMMEIHDKKEDFIRRICDSMGLTYTIHRDYAGLPRFVSVKGRV
jgi:release factor glutamine methyltransferase